MSARFALYLAPEKDDPLWSFGSEWLGYDAEAMCEVPQPNAGCLAASALREATAHPRLYGFHLTLKAPFRLKADMSHEALDNEISVLAQRHRAFGPIALVLRARKTDEDHVFWCLEPATISAPLMALEADAVPGLDHLRAPLDASEFARRRPERLAGRELAYLKNYGYPHVLDAFRPHFSLTGPVPQGSAIGDVLALELRRRPELLSFTCTSLALFEQPEKGARFIMRQRFKLPDAA